MDLVYTQQRVSEIHSALDIARPSTDFLKTWCYFWCENMRTLLGSDFLRKLRPKPFGRSFSPARSDNAPQITLKARRTNAQAETALSAKPF